MPISERCKEEYRSWSHMLGIIEMTKNWLQKGDIEMARMLNEKAIMPEVEKLGGAEVIERWQRADSFLERGERENAIEALWKLKEAVFWELVERVCACAVKEWGR
jgi:hypothetical protein